MQIGDNMSKYTIELRGNKDEKWRQYGEYDSYLSAWIKNMYESFRANIILRLCGSVRHIETRIVKLNEVNKEK